MRLVCEGCGAISLLAPGNEIEGGAKGNERLSLHTDVEILHHFCGMCHHPAMDVGIIKRLALAWIDVQVNDVWRGQSRHSSLYNPTATLECIAKICPCKMVVLQGPATRGMSV